jgi:hypothetical protein
MKSSVHPFAALLRVVSFALVLSRGAYLQAQRIDTPAASASSNESTSRVAVNPLPASPSLKPDEPLVLSPFEVVAATAKGYYAANSMSGTRFNTSLQDLASPISVVTKEQMQDFGMLDLNDVFLYSVNAEGTGTYSAMEVDRNGMLYDNVQLNPNTANRVRGLASSNISYGNFETSRRSPVDPLVLDRVEVSRGPNANVFGLGNPSGTVNQVPAYANTSRNRVTTEFRWDSYDGHRATLDINRVLLRDKLAVRFSAADQRDSLVRKPSGVDTVRYNAMVRFRPFQNTTLSASYFHYKAEGRRPNFSPPRDFVSYWIAMGRPSWDPVTQTVKVGGRSYGHTEMIAEGNPSGTYTDAFGDQLGRPWNALNRFGGQFQRANLYIDRDGIARWSTTVNNTGATPLTGSGSGANYLRLLASTAGPAGASGQYTNQPLFNAVAQVRDKGLYDWSSINLASPNYMSDTVDTFYTTIDHSFFNTDRHMLAAQAGFFSENAKRYQDAIVGGSSLGTQTGQLYVDPNERYLDGTPNPFFGRPYLGVLEPRAAYTPLKWETTRAQVIYKLDSTRSKGFWKWLGTHQVSPYYEYKYRVQRQYTYTPALASDHAWLAEGQPGVTAGFARGNQTSIPGGPQVGPGLTKQWTRFYVGDATGANVDYAPGPLIYGAYPFHWGTTGNWRAEPARLAALASSNGTGGRANVKTTIKTHGAVLQSHFLDGRLVTTLGMRKDETFSLQGATPQLMINNNTDHNFTSLNSWEAGPYRTGMGRTSTAGVVARPFRDFGLINRWANQGTGITRFFGELLQKSAFYYNRSDNFIPSPPAVDLFLRPLPNETGKGVDSGAWLNLFNDRLVIRINKYENKQLDIRNGDANTIAQRVLRFELTDLNVTPDRHRLYRRATDWWRLTNPTWTPQQVEARVLEQMKMTSGQFWSLVENFNAGSIAANNDITAKGTEIEVYFNPTRYWTISANGEEKRSFNSNISGSIQDYIDLRMPVWTTIVDQNFDPNLVDAADPDSRGWLPTPDNPNHLWWLHRYNPSETPAIGFKARVTDPYSVMKQQEGKSRPQVRRYAFRVSTNFKLAGITERAILKKLSVGGALRWEDKGAIGYWGVEQFPAVITALDPNRPIWDKARMYADLNASYATKLWGDKVTTTFRLNVRNLQENGRLQGIGAYPNGAIHSYRIVDPRQFILSAQFEF